MSLQFTAGVTRWWVGRGNAALTEPTSSHAKRLKTRRLPPVGCTLCWAVLGFQPTILFELLSLLIFLLVIFDNFLQI